MSHSTRSISILCIWLGREVILLVFFATLQFRIFQLQTNVYLRNLVQKSQDYENVNEVLIFILAMTPPDVLYV